jgi:hypothetical protein
VARIKINDLLKDMKISANELTAISGGVKGGVEGLVDAVAEQAAILRRSMDRLWGDLFIESYDPWAVPYLGDPVAIRMVSDARGRF